MTSSARRVVIAAQLPLIAMQPLDAKADAQQSIQGHPEVMEDAVVALAGLHVILQGHSGAAVRAVGTAELLRGTA